MNYLDLLFPLSILMIITSKNITKKYVFSACAVLLYSHIQIAHTRASWLSLVTVLIILLYYSQSNSSLQQLYKNVPKRIIGLMIVVTLLLTNISPNIHQNESGRFQQIFSSPSIPTGSISLRLDAYSNAIELTKSHGIIGTGLGSFFSAFKPYANLKTKHNTTGNFINLHNDPLQVIVELGLLGAALCFSFLIYILYKTHLFIINSSFSSTTKDQILYLGMFLGLISSFLHSFLSFPLHLPANNFISFIFLGLLIGNLPNQNKINIRFHHSIILSIFILGLLITASITYKNIITSEHKINLATKQILNFNKKGMIYSPINSPHNITACKNVLRLTDEAVSYYISDFHIQSWALSLFTQCTADMNKTLALIDRILKANPYHLGAIEIAAVIYFKQEKFKKSKYYAYLAQYINPLNFKYNMLLGHIAVKQQKYKKAQVYFDKVLAHNPSNNEAKTMILNIINTINKKK